MTLYYYIYRSWQECYRRGENRSWPSVSVESVDSECCCLNNAFVYAFIMRLTAEEHVLRSTFKLNTLYNPKVTINVVMLCEIWGCQSSADQELARNNAVYLLSMLPSPSSSLSVDSLVLLGAEHHYTSRLMCSSFAHRIARRLHNRRSYWPCSRRIFSPAVLLKFLRFAFIV